MNALRRRLQRLGFRVQYLLYERTSKPYRQMLPRSADLQKPVTLIGRGTAAYGIVESALPAAPVVYSLGVGNEISFDLGMIERFGATVHAFDPTPQSARFLAQRQLPAGFHYHQIAASGSDGEGSFIALKPASATYAPGALTRKTSSAANAVPMRRIGSLMTELGHTRIDVLKMDIEGGEYEVIDDLVRSKVDITQIAMEIHPYLANREHHGHMLGRHGWEHTAARFEALRALGYRVVHVMPAGNVMTLLQTGG